MTGKLADCSRLPALAERGPVAPHSALRLLALDQALVSPLVCTTAASKVSIEFNVRNGVLQGAAIVPR